MAGNIFINFGTDVPLGESLQKDHPGTKGWIEINDWSWDIETESSAQKGQGSSVGKASCGNLTLSHYLDISSPTILTKLVDGTHFQSITINMLKQTGEVGKPPQPYFQAKVKEAYVTKVATKGSGDGSMSQDVEFTFKQIALNYKPQLDSGALDTAIPFDWSIKANSLTTDIADKLK